MSFEMQSELVAQWKSKIADEPGRINNKSPFEGDELLQQWALLNAKKINPVVEEKLPLVSPAVVEEKLPLVSPAVVEIESPVLTNSTTDDIIITQCMKTINLLDTSKHPVDSCNNALAAILEAQISLILLEPTMGAYYEKAFDIFHHTYKAMPTEKGKKLLIETYNQFLQHQLHKALWRNEKILEHNNRQQCL